LNKARPRQPPQHRSPGRSEANATEADVGVAAIYDAAIGLDAGEQAADVSAADVSAANVSAVNVSAPNVSAVNIPAATVRAPAALNALHAPPVLHALNARLTRALCDAQPPASLQRGAALLQALRQTFGDDVARWFPLVPLPHALPDATSDLTAPRARDTGRTLGLDLSDLRVLHRAIRVVWLAEIVFGDRAAAHRWLCTPKRRLHGRVPLPLCQHGRYAALIEEWLVSIDEGNGP